MPAAPADIAAASRDAVTVTWESAAVAARYPSARDGSKEPATGFFDRVADAQTVADARGALLGAEARRFTAIADEPVWPDLAGGAPCARLIDAEQDVDATLIMARIEIDLEAGTTSFELFG